MQNVGFIKGDLHCFLKQIEHTTNNDYFQYIKMMVFSFYLSLLLIVSILIAFTNHCISAAFWVL